MVLLAWIAVPLSASALEPDSEPSPAPPAALAPAGAPILVAARDSRSDSRPAGRHETAGRFALPDREVAGTFHWFAVPAGDDSVAAEGAARVGRIEARGLGTALAAWWRSGELRIFRSETPRGNAYNCECQVRMSSAPAPAQAVAEALACMDLPVGDAGLELSVTRERRLEAPGAINRALRGLPEDSADACE